MKKVYIPILIAGVCLFAACKEEQLKNSLSNSEKSNSQLPSKKIETGDVARMNFSAIGYYAVSQGETYFLHWPTKEPPKNLDELLVLPTDVEFYSFGISPTSMNGFDLPPHLIGYTFNYKSASHDTQQAWPIYFSPVVNTNPQVYRMVLGAPVSELIEGKIPYDYCQLNLPGDLGAFFFRFDSPKKREELEAQTEALRSVLSDSNSAWPTEVDSTAFLMFSLGKRNCSAKFTSFDSKTGYFSLTISDTNKPSDNIEFDGKWASARRLVLKQRGDDSEWSLIYKGGKLAGEKNGEFSGVHMTINVSPKNAPPPTKNAIP